MVDVTSIIFGVGGILSGVLGGFILGKVADPYWKCSQLRKLTKKPYVVANLTRKDGILISTYVVNTEKDVIQIGSDVWVVTEGTIYIRTEGKVVAGKYVEGQIVKESGLQIQPSMLYQEQGCPVLYLNMDDLKPIKLHHPVGSTMENVKPSEIGPTLLAWVFNQYAKGLSNVKNNSVMMMITLFCALGAGALGFMNLQGITKIDKQQVAIQASLDFITSNLNKSGQIGGNGNGNLVIRQAEATSYPRSNHSYTNSMLAMVSLYG